MIEAIEILVSLFTFNGQGVPKEQLILTEKHKNLRNYLRLQTFDTPKLIQLYYQDMVNIQTSLKSSDYGVLFCRAYYHLKDETLVVEVFKCKGLEPMDNNGLSDPVKFLISFFVYKYILIFLIKVC
jgi:hypothetical protein